METTTQHDEIERLRELGAFLRSRRERLAPLQVGLPGTERRRTPGLRREEVAQRAGLGTTWYTWLEQGREVNASPEALTRLAGALCLDESERRLLFDLAGRPQPAAAAETVEFVPESLNRMLESLTGQPALVVGRLWHVLAWNPAAAALFGDYGRWSGDARNILGLLFANPEHRALLADWEMLARMSLANFRADTARFTGDADFRRLIGWLTESSAEFREWWPRRDVLRTFSGPKRIRHPRGGAMSFEHLSLTVQAAGDLKLFVYTPLEEDDTSRKLQNLLSGQVLSADANAGGGRPRP